MPRKKKKKKLDAFAGTSRDDELSCEVSDVDTTDVKVFFGLCMVEKIENMELKWWY